MKSNRLFN